MKKEFAYSAQVPAAATFCDWGAALLVAEAAGCGALLHPERIGQPRGDMDWEIVALDALGLILFFVPGVIAFIVDFTTGAIYLPPTGYSGTEPIPDGAENWRTVTVPRSELHRNGIAAAVTRETGKPVDLTAPEVQTRPLDNLQSLERETATLATQWEPQ